MAAMPFPLNRLFFLIPRTILRTSKNPRSHHHHHHEKTNLQSVASLSQRSLEFSNKTLIFEMEGALLKSSSMFPYFMLVAFEGGGWLRAFLLFFLYPLICLCGEDLGLQIMVMVCFFGIREKSFRAGRAVLPKFLLEDVGVEGLEVLKRGGRRVGVSLMPSVMVEEFLRDYLEVDVVVGRELKVYNGFYVGLMDNKKKGLKEIFGEEEMLDSNAVGIRRFNKHQHLHHHHYLFSHCKEIYMISEGDKRSWNHLTKENYPKPLIFHDGRLAIKPTLLNTFYIFMWVPFAIPLAITRILIGTLLPYYLSGPILSMMGLKLKLAKQPSQIQKDLQNPKTKGGPNPKPKGILYVCNHKTLLDPLYLSTAMARPITAVTYSLSRVSEALSPIRTVRLKRDRDQDRKMMEKLLAVGDLIVCPEGTTCREPYLLRFSPLFTEMSDEIVPVAIDVEVGLFYGTTAGGLKCLDPFFFMMNPSPIYYMTILEKVSRPSTCGESVESTIEMANYVQKVIAEALGFKCTKLTRKDKYLILAGNEGIVKKKKRMNNKQA